MALTRKIKARHKIAETKKNVCKNVKKTAKELRAIFENHNINFFRLFFQSTRDKLHMFLDYLSTQIRVPI